MAGRTASNAVTRYSGIQVQSSSLGLNIAVGWGTFRSHCNLVDYLDFKSVAQKASTGKGGGSTTTGYSYSATVILAICEGPIDSVSTVYVDSNVYTNGGTTALAQAKLSLNTGAIGQAVWSYLTSNHPTHAIGYSGLAIAYAANYALDSGASTPNHSFEVVRTASFGVGSSKDADPSLVISDFFTNARYGVPSWGSGLLGSLTQYQAYCLAAGLLISPVIDSQRSASDLLTEWLLATNSTTVWSEGVLKFIPYGDVALTGNGKTYTPNNTPLYNLTVDNFIPESDGDDPVKVDLEDQSDAYNVVQLEYLDRTNQYNMAIALASDAANVAQYDMRRQDPTTVHCICDPSVAALSAQLYLQRVLYIRGQYMFSLDDAFALLEPGDIVEITEPGLGLNAYPVRIIQIDENEDDSTAAYDITAEDFPIGIANSPLYTMQLNAGAQANQSIDPGGVEANLLLWSGDQTNGVYIDSNLSVVSNVATDQYGLTTADALVATAAAGTVGTPVQIASGTIASGGANTNTITTTVDAPAGQVLLLLAAHGTTTSTITGTVDSASNSYTAGTQVSSSGIGLRPFYATSISHLPIGGTNTTTVSVNASQYEALITIPNAGAVDYQGAGATATGTTPSLTTGALPTSGDVVIGFVFISAGQADTFTEAAGFTTGGSIGLSGSSILRWAYRKVTGTTSTTYAPTLGTSRLYVANVLAFKPVGAPAVHSITQPVATFAGPNYTFAVCLQANAHKNARIALADNSINGAYIEVNASTGAILTLGTVSGNAALVSATISPTLVSGIYQVVLTAQFPTSTTLNAAVLPLDDSGNLSWSGDGAQAINVSQWQMWQGLADGRGYAATTSGQAIPVIFNPPHVLNTAGSSGWAAVAGGPNWGGANVWISFDGTNYQNIGTVTAAARYGLLTANYGSAADPDTADTLAVDLGASFGELTSATDGTADNGGTLCLVDSELVCFSTATLTNPARYNLTTYVRRGYLNTPIAAHVTGGQIIRLDEAIFDFPFYATNINQIALVKFQSFNLWGGGATPLADCQVYAFVPNAVGARPPGSAAWSAVGASISNGGQTYPAILITGASDNPSADGVIFYYRITGQVVWSSAGLHPNSTTVYPLSNGIASAQFYDIGVAYQVNGVPGSIMVIATNIQAGAAQAGYGPGSTIVNSSASGANSATMPAGSYTHVDVILTGLGGNGYYVPPVFKGSGAGPFGGSGGSTAVKLTFAVTPGTTVISWNLSNTIGTPSTATATGLALSAPTGISATSSGSAVAPSAATGGTNNFAGHAGARTNSWDGGGAWQPTAPATSASVGGYTDQTSANTAGTVAGGGGSGSGPGASSNILIIARA